MWYRVFGLDPADVQLDDLQEHMAKAGTPVLGTSRDDAAGWFEADLAYQGRPLPLARYLVTEEGIRAELNSWAAWVEEQEGYPQRDHLMRQFIAVRQLFTLELADDAAGDANLHRVCLAITQYLAEKTSGYYQIDGKGLYDAQGNLLIAE